MTIVKRLDVNSQQKGSGKMNLYPVPPDTKEKEKVIGGLFDWGQFFWMLAGAAIGILLFAGTYITIGSEVLSAILGILGIATCLPFVFVKKRELSLFTYLMYKRKLKNQTGKLINKRKDVME